MRGETPDPYRRTNLDHVNPREERTSSIDSALLTGLFSENVAATADVLRADVTDVLAEEQAVVAEVAPKRVLEFWTGRRLARALIRARGFGDETHALLPDDRRVPVWPTGLVGSISHSVSKDFPRTGRSLDETAERALTTSLCVVAISNALLGVGVDVEPDGPIEADLEAEICRPGERSWLDEAPEADERGRRLRIIFSAKEAVYKAFFPRVREVWSFQEVGLEVDLERQCFRAALPPSAGRGEIEGRVIRRSGWILTAVEDDGLT